MPLMLSHLKSFFRHNDEKLAQINQALHDDELGDIENYDFEIQPGTIYAELAEEMTTTVGHIKLLSTANLRTAIDAVFQKFNEETRIALYNFYQHNLPLLDDVKNISQEEFTLVLDIAREPGILLSTVDIPALEHTDQYDGRTIGIIRTAMFGKNRIALIENFPALPNLQSLLNDFANTLNDYQGVMELDFDTWRSNRIRTINQG